MHGSRHAINSWKGRVQISLQKRTVLITGCSSGIGRALAEEFFRHDFNVYATARKTEALAPLDKLGVRTQKLDVTDPKSIEACIRQIKNEVGLLHILINNAGYGCMGPLVEMPSTELLQQFETNVFAPVNIVKEAFPLLRNSGRGIIVNIGSVSAILSTPFAGAYCASKAALHALNDAMRVEMAPFNIKVLLVVSGAVKSNFGSNAASILDRTFKQESVYSSIAGAVRSRANASQEKPVSTEKYARKLVSIVGKNNPPSLIHLGSGSRKLPFLKRCIPHKLLDAIIAKRFQLNHSL